MRASSVICFLKGIPFVRETIADYIERRDGFPANPDHIFCCNGASDGVKAVMEAILFDCNHGIMVPIPQYVKNNFYFFPERLVIPTFFCIYYIPEFTG